MAQVEGGTSNQAKYASLGPHTDKLHVFPWQIYPDMVVFDWLIRLGDKDRYSIYCLLRHCTMGKCIRGEGGHKKEVPDMGGNEHLSNYFTTGCPKKKLALGNTLFMTSGDVF